MAIKSVNALSHYTDWTVGHVHSGALRLGSYDVYWCYLSPYPCAISQGRMYSIKLVNTHFWLHTVGVVLYIVAMWISGVMQGLMWRAVNADGTLMYSFVQSLEASTSFLLMTLYWRCVHRIRYVSYGL